MADTPTLNPFQRFSKQGRIPVVGAKHIAKNIVVREDAAKIDDQRSNMFLREFGAMSRLHSNFPKFLDPDTARAFIINVGGNEMLFTKVLGFGAFGIVLKATVLGLGLDVAVKFIFSRASKQKWMPSKEFQTACILPQALVNSGRIIKYFAVCEKCQLDTAFAELIIMELAENGDLFDSIVEKVGAQLQPRVYTRNHARRHTISIIESMHLLRSHGFLHRDLKAENLLFNAYGTLVLGDIGNMKHIGQGKPGRQVRRYVLLPLCKYGLVPLVLDILFAFIYFFRKLSANSCTDP